MQAEDHALDSFVRGVIEQYRTKLIDLTGRNPLINFRHSPRSRGHVRVIEEIPEILFNKLAEGKKLSFEPLPDPDMVPPDEETPEFQHLLSRAIAGDEAYKQAVSELGPSPSKRQSDKAERALRDRLRTQLGFPPFQPTWDPRKRAEELDLNPSYDLTGLSGKIARRYTDSKIQTLVFMEELEHKLSAIREKARVLEKDAGFNALYCAFGFLEYYESDHSSQKREAPLVVLPVNLDRQLVKQNYSYFIQARDEEVQINVALLEWLKQVGISLPAWVEDEKEENPLGAYLARVEQAIAGKRDWKIRRYVTLGLFTFSTFAMYEDLNPERWPSDAPLERRPAVWTLIAGTDSGSSPQYAEDYEVDKLPNPEPLLIYDADSSQHSAVVDVLRSDSSQVIQGPPGTGKSQTITNIIAASLNKGWNVLFVAEKMAALDVVKKRLDSAGLGAFCLELHSSKTSKSAVVKALADRLEYRGLNVGKDELESNARALTKARDDLLYYVQHINAAAGKTGMKVCDVLLGSATRDELRNSLPAGIVNARFANAPDIDPHSYRQMVDAAESLERQTWALSAFGLLAQHPWRGLQNIGITELDETRLVTLFSGWNASIQTVLDAAQQLEERTGAALATTRRDIESMCSKLRAVPDVPEQDFAIETYHRCSSPDAREELGRVLVEFGAVTSSEESLGDFCDDVTAAESLGSEGLSAAVADLRGLGIEHFTVSAVFDLKKESRRFADCVEGLSEFCGTLSGLAGLGPVSIGALRACVAAAELLSELPRRLWSRRLAGVLDEANKTLLEKGVEQASKLAERRAALDAEFDLHLLPAAAELRAEGLALRSANVAVALFSAPCRHARRTFRGTVRDRSRKRRRNEVADGLLDCAQYIEDLGLFTSNAALYAVCGPLFDGLETPLAELAQVSNWAAGVRQRLAAFGDAGVKVQELLFSGSVTEFDRLLALREQDAFSSLTRMLNAIAHGDSTGWAEIVRQERARAVKAANAADQFAAARLTPVCDDDGIAQAITLIKTIKAATDRLADDSEALNLVGGSIAELRERQGAVRTALEYAESIARVDLPAEIVQFLFDDPKNISTIHSMAGELQNACSRMAEAGASVNHAAQLDSEMWCGAASFDSAPMRQLLKRNERAVENIGSLRDYASFILAEGTALDCGIGPVLRVYLSAGEDYHDLPKAVEFAFYRSIAEAVLNNEPRLLWRSGSTYQQLREQFRALDHESQKLNRDELAVRLTWRKAPTGMSYGPVAQLTESTLVERVAAQTRPRITVRDLMSRAGNAIQALMPCWLMSPMSVAQYLPRDLRFDLVIMDEASQIRPEEALGTIARGAKVVVVGDQMQLPPTPFFQKLAAAEADEDDEFVEDTRQESILETAAGSFHPSRRLKWHYRSEHDSLITFSNHEFYQDGLTVFPSPFYDRPDYGVSLVQTGGVYKAHVNQMEGEAVVKAAIEFMQTHLDQSLGIVAVNAPQAEFIRELLDKEIVGDPGATAYAKQWDGKLEDYFIKNLENVQGDERDVIFISTVYGKDESGKFNQRLGPINGIYGHRRLNVLFTRAKKKVVVFTSMSPEDIQDEGKHPGVGALKRYLQYARDGIIASVTPTGAECENDFERWVLQVLRAQGYEGVPQVGVSGYRIDIGVRHPSKPGAYLCGIECDGATYHSGRSVRERDRLRQEILERYGWKLYRIWSTDWFRNPHFQTEQMLKFLRQLHTGV